MATFIATKGLFERLLQQQKYEKGNEDMLFIKLLNNEFNYVWFFCQLEHRETIDKSPREQSIREKGFMSSLYFSFQHLWFYKQKPCTATQGVIK